MFGVLGASHPFQIGQSVIVADFIAMVDVDVEWRGWRAEEGEGDESMGKLGEDLSIADESDMAIAIMDRRSTEVDAGGFVTETAEG